MTSHTHDRDCQLYPSMDDLLDAFGMRHTLEASQCLQAYLQAELWLPRQGSITDTLCNKIVDVAKEQHWYLRLRQVMPFFFVTSQPED